MVGIGDQASHDSKDGERIDLHVCRVPQDTLLIQCNVGIVLLVDIEVFDQALSEEVREVLQAEGQVLDVFLSKHWSSSLAHYEGPDKSASISGNVDAIQLVIVVNGDKLLNPSTLTKQPQIPTELGPVFMDTYRLSIQEDKDMVRRVQLISCHEGSVLHPKVDGYLEDWLLWRVGRHMCRQGEILDETARLTLRGV